MTPRFQLKAATDDLHQQLDERLSRLDLATATDYRRFLTIHAKTVPPLEAALAAGGLGNLVDGWDHTRLSPAIEQDLATLGDSMPKPASAPVIHGTAQLLGTAYVLEGSRLGAQLLKDRVGDKLPSRFLAGDKSLNSWRTLIVALDQLLYSDALMDEAKDAARRCFALYLNAAYEAGI